MSKVLIIAEAGVNHNGNIDLAMKLVEQAASAGADIIKFQTFTADNIVSRFASKAEYQKKLTSDSESQYEMLKRLELSYEQHIELISHCKKHNIQFLSSAFDLSSVDLLDKLGIQIYKIPSGEITNIPYLRKIGKLNKDVILSTGMAYLMEIEIALHELVLSGTDRNRITILHCNTEYPTPMKDVNLNSLLTIQNAFKLPVGYSDHTEGIEIPIAAVAMGAAVIEKHFTLDRNMEGPDHKASIDPSVFANMVTAIRNVEAALGDGLKRPSESEKKNINIARKSIISKTNILKGEIFTQDNICIKRPGNGISPLFWDFMLGKKAKRDYQADELIIFE